MAQLTHKPFRQLGADSPKAQSANHSQLCHIAGTLDPSCSINRVQPSQSETVVAEPRIISNSTAVFGEHHVPILKPTPTQRVHNILGFMNRKSKAFKKFYLEPTVVKEDAQEIITTTTNHTTTMDMHNIDPPRVEATNVFSVLVDEADVSDDLCVEEIEEPIHEIKPTTPRLLTPIVESIVEDKDQSIISEVLDATTTNMLDAIMTIPDRAECKKRVSSSKVIRSQKALTQFLKCKYFMRARNLPLINSMVNDARVWMMKDNRKCDTDIDYTIMTSSIMAAYMIQREELEFRALLKRPDNYQNTVRLNNLVNDGNLGKVSVLGQYDYTENLASKILPSVGLPSVNLQF